MSSALKHSKRVVIRIFSGHFSRSRSGFMVIELVATMALVSILVVYLLTALTQFEEAEAAQELESGILAQLHYQSEVARGLPLVSLLNQFGTASTIIRNGANDLKLYGILDQPGRQAQVQWTLSKNGVDPGSGQILWAVTINVQAPLTASGGAIVRRQNTVFRALE